jgi:hypothetical protein
MAPQRSSAGAVARALAPLLVAAGPVAGQCELQKVLASGSEAGSQFGASLACDPDTALVGAWKDDNAAGLDSGALVVIERQGTAWVEVDVLTARDQRIGDRFGRDVSFFGRTAVVGASMASAPGGNRAGAAYVLERRSDRWVETQKLFASDGVDLAFFGRSLELARDEARVAISAYHDGPRQGAVYVFEQQGGAWAETAKLVAGDGAPGDNFGKWVALDGERLAIGANHDRTLVGGSPVDTGSAYVFELQGAAWVETAHVMASDRALDDRFGVRLDLVGDTLVVSARGADLTGAADAGAVYVFERVAGVWTETAKLTASDAQAGDSFGGPVRLADDEDTLVVGAFRTDDGAVDAGAVYVFRRRSGVFVETAKLVPRDPHAQQEFGLSLALSGDALAVGAWNDPTQGVLPGATILGAGAVYLYSLDALACPSLTADAHALFVSTGGAAGFTLDAGPSQAGAAYFLAGSFSGHAPGFDVGALRVPLNFDGYTRAVLLAPASAPLAPAFGQLDAAGQATATLQLPPASDPSLVGLSAFHAFATFDPGGLRFVSNPAQTFLLP